MKNFKLNLMLASAVLLFSFAHTTLAQTFNCEQLQEASVVIALMKRGAKIKSSNPLYKNTHSTLTRLFKNGMTFKTEAQATHYATQINKCFKQPLNFKNLDKSIAQVANERSEVASFYKTLPEQLAARISLCGVIGASATSASLELAKDAPSYSLLKTDLALYLEEYGFLNLAKSAKFSTIAGSGGVASYATTGLTGAAAELALPATVAFIGGLSIGAGAGMLDEQVGNPVGKAMQPLANYLEGVPNKQAVIEQQSELAATRYLLAIVTKK